MLRTGEARAKELKELDRRSAPDSIRATALNYLGDLARDAKDVKGAIDYYRRAAEVSPTNEVARLARLKGAALLSESEVLQDRRQALGIYLDLAESDDPQLAADYGAAHGALAMTTPGDTTMASLAEVEAIMRGGSARVKR